MQRSVSLHKNTHAMNAEILLPKPVQYVHEMGLPTCSQRVLRQTIKPIWSFLRSQQLPRIEYNEHCYNASLR